MTRKLLALAAICLSAAGASAAESERSMALDLRFGGYYPNVDGEFDDATPFRTTFGGDDRLLVQLGLERLLFEKFGMLGVGGSIGYVEYYGHGFFVPDPAEPDVLERATDATAFKVVPIYAHVAYRFDYAAQKWGVPVMPYGKAGIGYHIYWSTDGLGETSGGGDASGARLGVMGAVGAGLHLDAFDPRLAREFDADMGVNNSYLFAEYAVYQADGLGSEGFDLSDDGVLSFGLALDF